MFAPPSGRYWVSSSSAWPPIRSSLMNGSSSSSRRELLLWIKSRPPPSGVKIEAGLSLSQIQSCWQLSKNRRMLVPDAVVLAMEIQAALRTTGRDGRDTRAYPPDERRQSVVGSTEDPWRASQAWHRCRPDQRGQIYGAEESSSLAGMEDVPSQPC